MQGQTSEGRGEGLVGQATPYAAVQDLFSQAAARFGDSLAVDNGRRRVTYRELETKADRLARSLSALGVSRGSIVGLFVTDPVEIITAILATLKAGGVFCPLDPTFPVKRLRAMFESVSPAWCVTESQFVAKLDEVVVGLSPAPKLILVDDAPKVEGRADVLRLDDETFLTQGGELPSYSDPDAPCSVYFTSGSTGKPKAILGRLKGIDHFVRWEIGAVGAGHGTRVSQLASPSFDGFLKDAFVPLCSGGVVCAPESRDIILNTEKLISWLGAERVEVLHCVPSVFRSLINQGLSESYFGSMRWVVLTGEPLYPADVKRWMEVFGERIKLWNIYGTTETSMSKFAHEVTREDAERPSIPVGRPIKGAAVMVINSRGQLCREESIGEVYIRTPYRSHGYYGEPELTAEVFVPNPFGSDPSDLIHRTGDFGRLLPGGELELLGRRDQQVKVRGVRVELGEVENLLRGHEAVADVAVVDREDGGGGKSLVAYVTLANGAGAGALRGYLMERLPEAMVPSAIVEMESLPRTLGGKIDRKALPAVGESRGGEGGSLRGPVEEIVAGIWCEVLRVPGVGRDDNFFNLGGHSLLVTQVLTRVREFLAVELPVRSIFEAPTVEEFSRLVEQQLSAGRQSALEPIEKVSREGELPLSFAQQRLWFQEKLAGGSSAFNINLGVKLKGSLNVAAFEQSFGEVIRRHENLRTTFPLVGGELTQVISKPSRLTIPVVDIRRLPEAEQEAVGKRLAGAEFNRPFDLEAGPLVRVVLIRQRDDEHTVVCVLHHIVSDGWSRGLLVKEISALYEAF
ncbi:MAG: amino acid adenylation domain-containing protein, partial [Pyrinomonadaceae bacterium]